MCPEHLTVNGKEYTILRLLGKGKGGYSYLASDGARQVVLKQIHHEPCAYYTFGDKIEAELRDYQTLKALGLPMPALLEVDRAAERLVKEYVTGETIYSLVLHGGMKEDYLSQMRQMCKTLYAAQRNIDYFPTNFIVQNETLYYIDFECNAYSDEWNFENWGIKYWSQTPEFLQYVKDHA